MLKKWLFKLNRIVIWPLLITTLLFLATGFSITHKAYRLMPVDTALEIHNLLHPVFIPLFLIHVIVSVYFAVERWRRKPVKTSFLVQLQRFSAWVLLITILLYIFSGYSMSGKLPLDISIAIQIHRALDIVIIVFLLHAGINCYYILRKWLRS